MSVDEKAAAEALVGMADGDEYDDDSDGFEEDEEEEDDTMKWKRKRMKKRMWRMKMTNVLRITLLLWQAMHPIILPEKLKTDITAI
jgi:hypothetical protein